MLGADTFGVLIGLWPLYPNMVPVLLVACAVAYGVTGLVDHGVHRAGRAPSGLTYRPRRL